MPRTNGLTDKQIEFCKSYVVSRNSTEAALIAGYSKKTARVIGHENLQKPSIKEKIASLEENLIRVAVAEPEGDIVAPKGIAIGYSNAINFNPKSLFDPETGNPIPMHLLPDDVAKELHTYEVQELLRLGEGETTVLDRKVKYKWNDKTRNRDSLAKLFGLMNGNHDLIIDLLAALVGADTNQEATEEINLNINFKAIKKRVLISNG